MLTYQKGMTFPDPRTGEVLRLRAIDERRNIFREYELLRTIDLFGTTIVATWWGRIGTRGQQKQKSFADSSDADRYVAAVIRRRRQLSRRIGTSYVRYPG